MKWYHFYFCIMSCFWYMTCCTVNIYFIYHVNIFFTQFLQAVNQNLATVKEGVFYIGLENSN